MNELRALLLLELRSLWGINRFRHTKDRKEKNRFRLLGAVLILLMLMAAGYAAGLVYGLHILGLGHIAPAYLVTAASLVLFAVGLFRGSSLFSPAGYDLLGALPVKTGMLVLSRFLSLYLQDLLLSLLILLPGFGTYALLEIPALCFYPAALLGLLALPGIPLVVSAALSTGIAALSSRMKHKSLWEILLTVGFVVAVLLGSFALGDTSQVLTPEALADLADTIGTMLGRVYPPALWLQKALAEGAFWFLLLFLAVSLALLAGAAALVARFFPAILERLLSFEARHSYQLTRLQSRSLLNALFLKEAKGYFSCTIYATNTIIGPIMSCLFAGALCFLGADTVLGGFPLDVAPLLPFVFSAFFTMMTTTCASISMEGKQLWVVQSLPIPAKAWLDSKILLNLALMAPFYILSEVFLMVALSPGLWEALWLLAVPGCVSLFAVVFGITVNLRFRNFHWEKPEQVVKQGASAGIGGFAGFFASAIMGGVFFLTPAALQNLTAGVLCLGFLALTGVLYRKNNRIDLAAL